MPNTGEFTIADGPRPGRRVLVVDPDYDALAALAGALRARGIEVILAADGRTGLDRAVLSAPDVILVDTSVPLVDIRTFLEVVKGNPRTSAVPVFVMGQGDVRKLPFPEAREGAFGKPFQVDEVAARIEAVLAGRAGSRESRATDLQVRGDLAQVPLADILQVFSMNRRTGTFLLKFESSAGEVALRDGELIDARYGPAVGMKALVRMLREVGGQFQFVPDRAPARGSLSGTTEGLLVEGLRQNDELSRIAPELPPRHAVLYVARRAGITAPPDDAGKEILALAAEPRSLEQIFDRSTWLDIETALVVASLVRSGRLEVRSEGMPRAPLAPPDEMATLRGRVAQARRAGVPGPPRLLLPLPDSAAAGRLVAGLSAIADFAPESAPVDDTVIVRTLGTLRLGEGVDLDVFAVPFDPKMRPLWVPFAASAVGALLVASPDEEPAVRDAERFLRDEVEVPMCLAAWTTPWPGPPPEGDLLADGLDTPDGAASLVREVLGRLGSG